MWYGRVLLKYLNINSLYKPLFSNKNSKYFPDIKQLLAEGEKREVQLPVVAIPYVCVLNQPID